MTQDNPDTPPWERCDGSHTCPAETHFFGCFRSTIADDRRERSVAENPDSLVSERGRLRIMDDDTADDTCPADEEGMHWFGLDDLCKYCGKRDPLRPQVDDEHE